MIFGNNSRGAVMALERQRLGGDDDCQGDERKICPHCGYRNPEKFYTTDGECIGCSGCISQVEWEDYVV